MQDRLLPDPGYLRLLPPVHHIWDSGKKDGELSRGFFDDTGGNKCLQARDTFG